MPAAKKTETVKRKPISKEKKVTTKTKEAESRSLIATFKKAFVKFKSHARDFLARRPHRSFRRTRRRDYVRSLKMPGYFSFTHHVLKTLGSRKGLFIGIIVIYGLLTALFVGLASQQTYSQLSDAVSNGDQVVSGGLDAFSKAGILLLSSVTGGLSASQAAGDVSTQQVIVTILVLLITWLATVWLLRGILAGQKPRLRDGLYSSGSPIIPTFLVSLVLVFQLLPLALAMIGLSTAGTAGLLTQGIEAMIFWLCALLLIGLSLYWTTSTFIALVIVTLPGMYPMKALKTAGDLVIGRRIRILLRMVWSLACSAIAWIVIMIPVILLDSWIKQILPMASGVPIVPVMLLIMGSLTVVWSASYTYLLYRKVVDDDSAPA
jgi:hypothetical protein